MSRVYHARYIGSRRDLLFCGALTRPDPRSARHLLVQFDCVRIDGAKIRSGFGLDGEDLALCFGWHRFKRSDFKRHRRTSQTVMRQRERDARREWQRVAQKIAAASVVTLPKRKDPQMDAIRRYAPQTWELIRRDQSGWMP